MEKYLDQTSSYLVMFDIKKCPINEIFEGRSFSKNFCSWNFSYQPSLPLLRAGIKWFGISISDIACVTIVIYYLQRFRINVNLLSTNFRRINVTNRLLIGGTLLWFHLRKKASMKIFSKCQRKNIPQYTSFLGNIIRYFL